MMMMIMVMTDRRFVLNSRPEDPNLVSIYYVLHFLIVSYIFKYQFYTEARFLHATSAIGSRINNFRRPASLRHAGILFLDGNELG
jgi:hypothetical protein